MDTMLSLGVFTLEEMLLEVPRFNRRRGIVQLRALGPLARAGSESFGESSLRMRWCDAGLPEPTLQIPVLGDDGRVLFWLDMGIEELLFAAEYDGWTWHSTEEDVAADTSRRAWLADQRGWMIEVFRQEHVYGHGQDADVRLRQAFAVARATIGQRTHVI